MPFSLLFLYIYWRKIRFLSVLRGEVSTAGEHSCKNGYTHTQTDTELPGLRSKICTTIPGAVIRVGATQLGTTTKAYVNTETPHPVLRYHAG